MFIVEDNILWLSFDHTGSHENWFQGCKIDLITHPNLAMDIVFSIVVLDFRYFINIHEYENEIIFI